MHLKEGPIDINLIREQVYSVNLLTNVRVCEAYDEYFKTSATDQSTIGIRK